MNQDTQGVKLTAKIETVQVDIGFTPCEKCQTELKKHTETMEKGKMTAEMVAGHLCPSCGEGFLEKINEWFANGLHGTGGRDGGVDRLGEPPSAVTNPPMPAVPSPVPGDENLTGMLHSDTGKFHPGPCDEKCVTLPDGSCRGEGCMHDSSGVGDGVSKGPPQAKGADTPSAEEQPSAGVGPAHTVDPREPGHSSEPGETARKPPVPSPFLWKCGPSAS